MVFRAVWVRTSEGQCILPTAPSPCISDGLMDCLAWATRLRCQAQAQDTGKGTPLGPAFTDREEKIFAWKRQHQAKLTGRRADGRDKAAPLHISGDEGSGCPAATLVGQPGTPGCGGAILPPGIGADGGDGAAVVVVLWLAR